MIDLLDWGKLFVVPFGLLLITTFFRRLGRRDGDPAPRKNDFAVATSVLLMAFATVIRDLQNATTTWTVNYDLVWLVIILSFTVASSDHDRHDSWMRDPAGGLTNEKRAIVGILLPNLVSMGLFVAYQYFKELRA